MGIQDSHDGTARASASFEPPITTEQMKQMADDLKTAREYAEALSRTMAGASTKLQFKIARSLSYDEAKRIIAQARHKVLLRPEARKWLLHSSYLGLNGHPKFREAVRQEVENLQPRGSEYLPLYHFMTNTWNIDGRNISDEMFDFLNLGEGTRPAMDDDRARPIVDENGLPYTRSGSVEWGVTPDNAAKHEFIQVVQCATGCGILVPSDGSEREPICEQCVVEMDAEDNL